MRTLPIFCTIANGLSAVNFAHEYVDGQGSSYAWLSAFYLLLFALSVVWWYGS